LGFEPEGRSFKAHLTLARIKAPGRTGGVLRALEAQKKADLGKITVDKIVLFKSTLKPTGAVYTALEEVTLGEG
jgi:2'-5' RNA ligase